MARPIDIVFDSLKRAKGPGDVFRAITQDKMLMIGILILIALMLLFLRIYLWPQVNPFQFKWFSDIWNWLTTPRKVVTPDGEYPYAKVIYPEKS
jgi:hypothetical protein